MNVNPYLFMPELFTFLIIALLFVQAVGSVTMREKVWRLAPDNGRNRCGGRPIICGAGRSRF